MGYVPLRSTLGCSLAMGQVGFSVSFVSLPFTSKICKQELIVLTWKGQELGPCKLCSGANHGCSPQGEIHEKQARGCHGGDG